MRGFDGFKVGQMVQGEVVEAYVVVTNTDLNEGKGYTYNLSYHRTEREALLGAHKNGVMGTDADVALIHLLHLEDGRYLAILKGNFVELYEEDKGLEEKIKERALSKLRPAEIAALLGTTSDS